MASGEVVYFHQLPDVVPNLTQLFYQRATLAASGGLALHFRASDPPTSPAFLGCRRGDPPLLAAAVYLPYLHSSSGQGSLAPACQCPRVTWKHQSRCIYELNIEFLDFNMYATDNANNASKSIQSVGGLKSIQSGTCNLRNRLTHHTLFYSCPVRMQQASSRKATHGPGTCLQGTPTTHIR